MSTQYKAVQNPVTGRWRIAVYSDYQEQWVWLLTDNYRVEEFERRSRAEDHIAKLVLAAHAQAAWDEELRKVRAG